ncbi:MAG: hypothetical protein WAU45_22535 [Blastocatellia bacterium]
MASLKQPSANRRNANISEDTRASSSNTRYYDVDREQRSSLRKEAWADGFLTSNGTQIPLFIPPAQQLK